MRMRLLAGAGAAMVLVSVAAQGAGAGVVASGGSAGVAKARATGVSVDPAAAKMMARAPQGTCANDPTQAKCPPITEVVAAQTAELPDGSVAYGPGITASEPSTEQSSNDARAAQVPQCFLKADYPYYSGGWAWGQGVNTCTAAASSQSLFVWLKRTNSSSQWVQLDSRYAEGGPNQTIRRTAGYNCGHTNRRHYMTQSDGYSVVKGTMYAATQQKREWLTCP